MHIAYLINQYPKVSHTFVRREIIALEEMGLTVTRIAMRGWSDVVVDKADQTEKEKTLFVLERGVLMCMYALLWWLIVHPVLFTRALLHTFCLSRRSDKSILYHGVYFAEACRVACWLKEKSVAHLHAHFGTNSTEVALVSAQLAEIPFSFTVHGPEEFDRASTINLSYKLQHAAFVAAVSSFGRSQLYRYLDAGEWGKIHIIRCGVDKAFGLNARPPTTPSHRLVCVGRLCEQKGQLLLLRACYQLKKMGTPFTLALVGDGEMRRRLEEEIQHLNLRDCVTITGWLSSQQVKDEMLNARAMVLPSFAEGLPVVIMEAMALGRIAVSTFIAGIPELVNHNINGMLTPAGDVDALARALSTVLRMPLPVLQTMGFQAQQDSKRMHSVEVEAHKLAALFVAAQKTEAVPGKSQPSMATH